MEKRTLRTTTILTKHQDWAGLQQGFKQVRERTEQMKKTEETVHGITSLSAERANAQRLLELTPCVKSENRYCPAQVVYGIAPAEKVPTSRPWLADGLQRSTDSTSASAQDRESLHSQPDQCVSASGPASG
jgi:hypothetical protein